MRRRVGTVAAVLLLTGTLATPALADDPSDALDALPDSAWARSVTALSKNVTMLDDNITALSENIVPLDTRTTEGEETVISLSSDILFDFGESTIGDRAEDTIAELVADVPDGQTVQVHGHTDSIGPEDFNQTLSEDRAATVAEVIERAQPDLELEVEGFGMHEPTEPNVVNGEDNPEGRALNRRVEIRFEG